MVESDVVIYDLHFGNINDVEFAIDAYKKRIAYEPLEDQKTLVLVSSCMVWDDTPRKIKPKEEEKKEGDDEDGAGGDGGDGDGAAPQDDQPQADQDGADDNKSANSQDIADIDDAGDGQGQDGTNPEGQEGQEGQETSKVEEVKPEEPPVYEPFKEEDYPMRTPSEKYIRLKELEDLVLSLKIENLKTYVICPGIFYGKGEVALKQHLKVILHKRLKVNSKQYVGLGCMVTIAGASSLSRRR